MRRLLIAVVLGVLLIPQGAEAHWARGIRPRIVNVSVNRQSTQTVLWGRHNITNYRFKAVRVRCWFRFSVSFHNFTTGEARTYSKIRAWKGGAQLLEPRTRYVRGRIAKTAVSHPSLAELGPGWERDSERITVPHCHVA